MNNTKAHRLGEYIREVDIRNHNLQCQNLLGLSIAKEFIPSIANIIGTDLRSYKVVKNDQFAYVPVTSRNGEKITVAHYCEIDNCIISQAYTVFEVFKKDELLPDYLMLWFRRPEFDRYARFMSHGSAREVFDWDELCNTLIPIPSIDKQRNLVNQYNSIKLRIENNKLAITRLEDAAQAIYHKMFVDSINPENLPEGWTLGEFSDIANVTMGQSPSGETLNKKGDGILFYQGCSDFGIRVVTPRVYTTSPTKYAEPFDILMSVRAPVGSINITKEKCCIGRGLAAIRSKHGGQSFVLYTLKNLSHEFSIADSDGSVFGSINKDGINSLSIILPPSNLILEYNNKISPLDELIVQYESEINVLYNALATLL